MEKKSEIVAISNKYKNILDDLINSSDEEFLDWLGLIDKRSRNARFEDNSIGHSEEDSRLDNKNVLDTLLGLEPKTQDSQVYYH